jgi:phosphatidylglycerophosphatase A
VARFNLKKPTHFLALGFGLGLAPKAPGTFGTLAAIPFILITMFSSLWLQIAVAVLLSLIGIWLCDVASKDAGVHDDPAIVWDEIAGFYITMLGITISWKSLLIGFILFRFFDIVKPWPIKLLDKHVKGGFGIMVDDIFAGFASLLCLHFLVYLGLI